MPPHLSDITVKWHWLNFCCLALDARQQNMFVLGFFNQTIALIRCFILTSHLKDWTNTTLYNFKNGYCVNLGGVFFVCVCLFVLSLNCSFHSKIGSQKKSTKTKQKEGNKSNKNPTTSIHTLMLEDVTDFKGENMFIWLKTCIFYLLISGEDRGWDYRLKLRYGKGCRWEKLYYCTQQQQQQQRIARSHTWSWNSIEKAVVHSVNSSIEMHKVSKKIKWNESLEQHCSKSEKVLGAHFV